MIRKWIAALLALMLLVALTACGEEETTTVSGMVVAVDGSVISLVEMDGTSGGMNFDRGEMPQDFTMPEDMEGFQGFGGFGGFSGEGWNGQMPEGFNGQMPEGFNGQMPEGFDGQLPEDFTMPQGGQRPENGGGRFDFGGMTGDMETTEYNVANAHISVQEDGVKASGSMSDLTIGASVTLTINSKGEVTNVLVTGSGFGGNFGGRGGRIT